MTLNPFERVVVSLKLLHYSSPPASLVFGPRPYETGASRMGSIPSVSRMQHSSPRSYVDPISVSFPVNPRPDGGAPVNRHIKSSIDATRALIGQALVLMTLNPFERVERMS